MATLDELTRELPDPDLRTEPRDEAILAAVQAAAPRVIAEAAMQDEANEVKAAALERADAAWRQEMDEEAFSLMIDHDMYDEWMP